MADTDDNKKPDTLQRLRGYIPLASLYAVVVGTLYLWGYWSAFEINILQYIGLVDLAKAAAFPLASAVASIAVSGLLGQVTAGRVLPDGGGADTPTGRFLNTHVTRLLAIYVVSLLALLIFSDNQVKWFVVGILASMPLAFAIGISGALSDVIANQGMRRSVVWFLSMLICCAFGFGRLPADDIISGREYFAVDQASIDHVDGVRASRTGELKYLGHAGDYVFLLAPDSSIEILRADAVPALVIQHRSLKRKLFDRRPPPQSERP